MKDPLNVQSVCGTGLVVGAPLQIARQLPRPRVVDAARRPVADGVLRADQDYRDLGAVPQVRHLGVVVVHGIEARLVLQAEHEDYRVDPSGELDARGRGGRSWIKSIGNHPLMLKQ